MRIDQTCEQTEGTKDAIHVPYIVIRAEYDNKYKIIKPGDWVKFTDDKFTKVEVCDKNSAHGIVNPFLDDVYSFENVIILLKPGITTPVRHEFDIDPKKLEIEKRYLASQLQSRQDSDEECADCYAIRNNEVIRW